MEKSIVSAAKWLGVCLVLSSFIIVVGLHSAVKENGRQMSAALSNAATLARPSATGQVQLVTPNQIQLAPLSVRISGDDGSPLIIQTRPAPAAAGHCRAAGRTPGREALIDREKRGA